MSHRITTIAALAFAAAALSLASPASAQVTFSNGDVHTRGSGMPHDTFAGPYNPPPIHQEAVR